MKITKFLMAGALFLTLGIETSSAQAGKTKNIVIVMTDGLRWQEMFRGADPAMFSGDEKAGALGEVARRQYLLGSPRNNRAALMPFFWHVVAAQGQVFGDQDLGSSVLVRNGYNFSYPGYNETLTGRPNPEINRNDFPDNTRATVLEWLNEKPSFRGEVAAFAMWKAFDHILRRAQSGIPGTVAYEPLVLSPMSQELKTLNDVKASLPHIFGEEESLDAPVVYQALDYIREKKPRVVLISCGETDVWAHKRDYPQYLEAAHRYDNYLRLLWETLQSIPEYRGSTTLVLSTDHGRGNGEEWASHGAKIHGAEDIWTAYLGPDTKPLGLRENTPTITQGQLAATAAKLLGEDFQKTDASITPPIVDVLHP